jgi:[ribosomal protein S5]-alanine N-acetyltransferase
VGESVILETERLRLREFTLADADALERVLGDSTAMEFYPAAFDRAGVEAWIVRNQRRYREEGSGLWAVVLKASGEVIGDCGCVRQEVEGRTELEIGYHVRRDLWGNGYATEAARACLDYAFTRLGAAKTISMIRPENLRSRRVAEKTGLTCEKVIFWRGYDHCVYVRRKSQPRILDES